MMLPLLPSAQRAPGNLILIFVMFSYPNLKDGFLSTVSVQVPQLRTGFSAELAVGVAAARVPQ